MDGSGRSIDERPARIMLWILPALFATNNVAARMADGVVSPVALAFWRWALTFALLLPFVVRALGRNASILRAEWPRLLVLGSLGMAVASLGTYIGALTTSAGNIGLIYASTPGMILILDRLVSDVRLAPVQVIGMVACVGGMVFIVLRGDPAALLSVDVAPGDLWAAAGAFGWACYSVLLKHWHSALSLLERAAMTGLAGALVVLPLYAGEAIVFDPPPLSLQAIAIILTVAIVSGVFVIVLHAKVTAVLGPRRAVVLLYLIPLYNLLLAWLVLGEPLRGFQVVGGAMILFGIWLAERRAAPPRDAAVTPSPSRSFQDRP